MLVCWVAQFFDNGHGIIQVACGVGHTLFLIKPSDAEGLPEWEPPADVPTPAAPGGKKRTSAAPKKGAPAAKKGKK